MLVRMNAGREESAIAVFRQFLGRTASTGVFNTRNSHYPSLLRGVFRSPDTEVSPRNPPILQVGAWELSFPRSVNAKIVFILEKCSRN